MSQEPRDIRPFRSLEHRSHGANPSRRSALLLASVLTASVGLSLILWGGPAWSSYAPVTLITLAIAMLAAAVVVGPVKSDTRVFRSRETVPPPAPYGLARAESPPVPSLTPSGDLGTVVRTEALRPLPPRVISGTGLAHPRAIPRLRPASEPARSTRCADCRTEIRDPKMWRRCSDCLHPLCTHCIVEALLAYEAGWCTRCAGLRHLDLLAKELGPAARSKLNSTTHRALEGIVPSRVAGGPPSGERQHPWREPDWFVKIPRLRVASPRPKTSIVAESRVHVGRDPISEHRKPRSFVTSHPGRLGTTAAGI
jgi:hypothetical protein